MLHEFAWRDSDGIFSLTLALLGLDLGILVRIGLDIACTLYYTLPFTTRIETSNIYLSKTRFPSALHVVPRTVKLTAVDVHGLT